MRHIAVSIIAIFATIPAFADARLPIVNVGAGSVSARAAFGESMSEPVIVQVSPLEKKTVVARSGNKSEVRNQKSEIIAMSGDFLAPKRPSNDLWAKMEKPLRLPEPEEFSVMRSDYELPEESLDIRFAAAPSVVARGADNSGLDAEIAKLVELQRRADESVKVAEVRRPSTIRSYDLKPGVTSRAAKTQPLADVSVRRDFDTKENLREEVSLSRVVIPMTEDVVVRTVKKSDEPKIASMDDDMSKMSPTELKKAFKKTYLSENKHLSTYQIDDRFDVASDTVSSMEGFTTTRDLSEVGGVRPLEIKIGFRGEDSGLSRDNYNLLSEYASIVVSNPKRAIQISIPERATRSADGRKLAARRLAIVEQVLRDTGVTEQRIMPVLAQRSDDSFVLRVISSDQFETMTQQKRDMFGDSVSKKTYKSMSW